MNPNFAYAIRIFHYMFILFIIFTPFLSNTPEILDLHTKIALILILKWLLKWWECGFTLLEHHIRGGRKEDGFIYQILNPLFNISHQQLHILIFITTIILASISLNKYLLITKKL